VFPIHLPPLRERPSDIIPLAEHILGQVTRRLGKRIVGFSPDAAVTLTQYRWPGNIRELQNVVERAAILCQADHIEPAHLNLSAPSLPAAGDAPKTLKDLEREAILKALAASGGNRRKTAEQLGIGLRTLYTRLKELGIFTEHGEDE
jgi:DNA-binding NtrC family response regulator